MYFILLNRGKYRVHNRRVAKVLKYRIIAANRDFNMLQRIADNLNSNIPTVKLTASLTSDSPILRNTCDDLNTTNNVHTLESDNTFTVIDNINNDIFAHTLCDTKNAENVAQHCVSDMSLRTPHSTNSGVNNNICMPILVNTFSLANHDSDYTTFQHGSKDPDTVKENSICQDTYTEIHTLTLDAAQNEDVNSVTDISLSKVNNILTSTAQRNTFELSPFFLDCILSISIRNSISISSFSFNFSILTNGTTPCLGQCVIFITCLIF